MTARTTREAFGQQLTREAFEDPTAKDRPVVVAVAAVAGAFLALSLGGDLADRFGDRAKAVELAAHECRMLDTLAGDREVLLWTCKDGYRTSPAGIIDRRGSRD